MPATGRMSKNSYKIVKCRLKRASGVGEFALRNQNAGTASARASACPLVEGERKREGRGEIVGKRGRCRARRTIVIV